MGYSPESEKCEPIMDFAGTALNACNFVDEDGKPCEEWHRERGVCCVEACDDWVMPFLETSRPSINLSKNISKNITLNSSVYEANNSTKSVFGCGNSEAASLNIYNITLNNNQNTSLSNITLNITIPKDMIIKNTINSDNLNPNIDPAIFNRNSNTSLTWNIPNIMGNESKWFIFEAYLKKDTNINNTQIKINVEGYAPDYGCSPVKASLDGARPIKCLHINKFGNPCNDEDIKSKNCTELCPDWEIK